MTFYERSQFEKAHGWYARVEAGDALFIPRQNWHAVVALEPSISMGIFGLTPLEIILRGGFSEAKLLLHRLHLSRRGKGRGVSIYQSDTCDISTIYPESFWIKVWISWETALVGKSGASASSGKGSSYDFRRQAASSASASGVISSGSRE